MFGLPLDRMHALRAGEMVSFKYNDKVRVGTVDVLGGGCVTIKNNAPHKYDGKVYSTYRFNRFQTLPKVS